MSAHCLRLSFRGVTKYLHGGGYYSYYHRGRLTIPLGVFVNIYDAAQAVDAARLKFEGFDEHVRQRLNLPERADETYALSRQRAYLAHPTQYGKSITWCHGIQKFRVNVHHAGRIYKQLGHFVRLKDAVDRYENYCKREFGRRKLKSNPHEPAVTTSLTLLSESEQPCKMTVPQSIERSIGLIDHFRRLIPGFIHFIQGLAA